MDFERALVSKILRERDLASVIDRGVTREMFYDQRSQAVFDLIRGAVAEHGAVPSLDYVRRNYPTYQVLAEVTDPYTLLIEGLKNDHALTIFETALGDAVTAFDRGDLDRIQHTLTSALAAVNETTATTQDLNLRGTGQQRLDRYEEMQDRDPDDYLGIPLGFPSIDQATQGAQDGQLVVLVGPPKAGKSTMLLLAARSAWQQRKKVLFIGFEMSNEEQHTRFDAIEAGIDHSVLRGGKDRRLSERAWEDLEDALAAMDSGGVDFIFSNDAHSTTTLSGIAAKIERYRPDIVFVDGVYMMADEYGEKPGSPQALTNLTRGFKRMAFNKDLPIYITTQVLTWKMDKRRGVTADSVGYSSSFSQDADALIAAEPTEDDTVKKLKILLARNAVPGEIFVRWDWERAVFEELDGDPFEEPYAEPLREPGEGGDDAYNAATY